MSNKVYLDDPSVGEEEKKYLNHAIDTGFVSMMGPLVDEFETKFAKYLGLSTAVSTQSGTAGIHMALYELGIKKGDEVIVPNLTFIATVNPVLYCNATPVFVDVDIKTWNINPEKIEKAITKKTKAIIPVHLYGNPCKMDEIIKIAKQYNLFVIEDATESLGAKYKNKYTGTFGDFGVFSFNGNKIITTGGGGMVVGKSAKRLTHIKFLVNQARDKTKGYYHPEVGFNYRMTNIEAALGLAQLKKLNAFLKKKLLFAKIYKQELSTIENISFQEEYPFAKSSYWLFTIFIKKSFNKIVEKLKEKKIPFRRIFMPITEFPPYKKYKKDDYKNSYEIYKHGICLPCSTLNTEEGIYSLCKKLKPILSLKK